MILLALMRFERSNCLIGLDLTEMPWIRKRCGPYGVLLCKVDRDRGNN